VKPYQMDESQAEAVEPNGVSQLTEEETKELYRLQRFYWAEAKRCEEAKAHLAGCVMLGSAVETLLILFANIYFDEAFKTGKAPTERNGRTKHLLDWKLSDLLRVAEAANWFPATIEGKKVAIRDSSGTLRQIRNLVHPAAYLRDHGGKRVTRKFLDFSFETALDAREWLLDRVETELARHLQQEGAEERADAD
jgi:hypothetical protein